MSDQLNREYAPPPRARTKPRFERLGEIMSPGLYQRRNSSSFRSEDMRQSNQQPSAPKKIAKRPRSSSTHKSAGDVIADVRAAERKRLADVFAKDVTKGRYQMAAMLLSQTSMSADAIGRMLNICCLDKDNPQFKFGSAKSWAEIHAEILAEREA